MRAVKIRQVENRVGELAAPFRRLGIEYIQPGAELARRQGRVQRRLVDDFPAGGIDEDGPRLHQAKPSRIHQLSREVYRQAAKRSELTLLSSADDKMYGSLITFQMKPEHFKNFNALCVKKKIWIVRAERLRVATHVHTRPQDIKLFFETIDEAAKA